MFTQVSENINLIFSLTYFGNITCTSIDLCVSDRAGNYENIDQPVPTNTVETASPHSTIDKTSPYGPTP